jgi:anaerobic dimethyl sulfoxide reductase subunit B
MSEKYRILFVKDKCIQCFGCEIACKSWRNVETGVRLRIVKNIWYGKYPDIHSSSISLSCMHCDEPACMDVCPSDAISSIDGIISVDSDKCSGCNLCLEACPIHIPQFGINGTMQKCDLCIKTIDAEMDTPPCVLTCPTKALIFIKIGKEERRKAEQSVIDSI